MKNFKISPLDMSANPMLEILAKDPVIRTAIAVNSDSEIVIKAKHRLAAVFVQVFENSTVEGDRARRKKTRRNLMQFLDALAEKNYDTIIPNHDLLSCIRLDKTSLSYNALPDFMKTFFPEKVIAVQPYVPTQDFLRELIAKNKKSLTIDLELLEQVAGDAGVGLQDLEIKHIPITEKFKAFVECAAYDTEMAKILKQYCDHMGEQLDGLEYDIDFIEDLDDIVDHELITFTLNTFLPERSIGVKREVDLEFSVDHVHDLCEAIGTLISHILQKEDVYNTYLQLKSQFEPGIEAGDENYALEA